MIRVATLDPFDSKEVGKLCQILYTAFGVGTEAVGKAALAPEADSQIDADKLLAAAPDVHHYADDKILYLTSRKLKDRSLGTGNAPTTGYASYGKDRALVSTHPHKDLETALPEVARLALHQVGHLWGLHHCLDPRCAMYAPWTPSFPEGDATFCNFCREKSEQRIRLAKS